MSKNKPRRDFMPGFAIAHASASLSLGAALAGLGLAVDGVREAQSRLRHDFGGGDYAVPPRRYRVPKPRPKTPAQVKRDRKRDIAKASRKRNRKA